MSLSDFFQALDNNNAVITINDDTGNELVKVYASGSDQLLASLLSRNVAKFKVTSPNAITVDLAVE